MDPQDYQHACERAELLGLPKPSEEEWRQTQTTQNEDRCNDDDGDALQVIGEKNSCESGVASGVYAEKPKRLFVIDRTDTTDAFFAERSVIRDRSAACCLSPSIGHFVRNSKSA